MDKQVKTDLFQELKTLLLTKLPKYFSDDEENKTLLRNALVEDCLKLDKELIKVLLSSKVFKDKFFVEIEGTLVFDKEKFSWLVNNKEFLPDSFTSFKQNIGLTDENNNFVISRKEIVLSYPYKDCVLEGGQTKEDQKKDEIFYNEILAPDDIDCLLEPKVFTNIKKYTREGEEEINSFDKKENLLIKGNNLLVLSSLLKRYKGEIKLIYIDPPYFFDNSTETDAFRYNSNFTMSTWLTFLKNRLEIARKLLCPGGTIWISINDDGMHYLKVLCDEIFKKENFVATLPRRTRDGKSDVPFNLSQDFDWILCYTNVDKSNKVMGRKVEKKYYETPDFPGRPWRLADLTTQKVESQRRNSAFDLVDPKTKKVYKYNPNRLWGITKDTFQEYYDKGAIVFPDDYDFLKISVPYARYFKDDDEKKGKLSSVISDFLIKDFLKSLLLESKNKHGNKHIESLLGNEKFSYSKPENLIKSIIENCTNEGDLVLDFFAGSGTTASTALKLNRKFICVEQMDYIEEVSLNRLNKVLEGEQGGISKAVNWQGGGSFVYCELKELNQNYLDKIKNAGSDVQLIKLYDEISHSKYISTKVTPNVLESNAKDFESLSTENKRNLLIQLIDLNMLYVNYSDIEDEDYQISEQDKKFNKSFYGE